MIKWKDVNVDDVRRYINKQQKTCWQNSKWLREYRSNIIQRNDIWPTIRTKKVKIWREKSMVENIVVTNYCWPMAKTKKMKLQREYRQIKWNRRLYNVMV